MFSTTTRETLHSSQRWSYSFSSPNVNHDNSPIVSVSKENGFVSSRFRLVEKLIQPHSQKVFSTNVYENMIHMEEIDTFSVGNCKTTIERDRSGPQDMFRASEVLSISGQFFFIAYLYGIHPVKN